jgi:hypothetical protein
MDHSVRHGLDLATAKRVAEHAWESYAQRFSHYDPRIEWVTEHKAKIGFRAKGVSLDGELALREGAIDLTLEVPFLLRPFKQKAISVIEQEIEKWVEKAKSGQV